MTLDSATARYRAQDAADRMAAREYCAICETSRANHAPNGCGSHQFATGCPMCGDEMTPRLVVCWSCWFASNRLTPGTYAARYPDATPATPRRYSFTITAADVTRYQEMRDARLRHLHL